MSLENYTGKIADMVATNPTPTDPKSQGDDHLRGIKYTIQQDAVSKTGDQTMAGKLTAAGYLSSIAQGAEINALTRRDYVDTKVSKSGDTMTGQLTVSGGSPVVLKRDPATQASYFGFQNNSNTLRGVLGYGTTGENLEFSNITTGSGIVLQDSEPVRVVIGNASRWDFAGNTLINAGANPVPYAYGTWLANTGTLNLGVAGSPVGSGYILFGNDGAPAGAITYAAGNNVLYGTSSDYRLKDNVKDLTGSGTFIDSLRPRTWTWKFDNTHGVGFIAHEAQTVSPLSVVGEKDGEQMQSMQYGSGEIIANLVAELQSLRKRVSELEAK